MSVYTNDDIYNTPSDLVVTTAEEGWIGLSKSDRRELKHEYQAFKATLETRIDRRRIITDEARVYSYGTDASFYRMTPQIVILSKNEDEVSFVLKEALKSELPVTFRASGTSLSGQAISDSILLKADEFWTNYEVIDGGRQIKLQPGIVGARANQVLAPWGRKLGPDPASINAARIGGIASNNASGMCCGTAGNSYYTMDSLRVVLHDGTILDTGCDKSKQEFKKTHQHVLDGLTKLREVTLKDQTLTDLIKYKYRLKNTTGYAINSIVDYEDPFDILAHLIIGSEGTLGFISNITYNTVEEHNYKASTVIVFDSVAEACNATHALSSLPVSAVELMDRRGLRSIECNISLPEWIKDLPESACALLIDTRHNDQAVLNKQRISIENAMNKFKVLKAIPFTQDPKEYRMLWNIRKGMFPAVGALRETGTTVIIEDVAVPLAKMAEVVVKLQGFFDKYNYTEALIFGHALMGNCHFVFTQRFDAQSEIDRYSAFMDDVAQLIAIEYGGSLKAEHGTGRNMAPFVELEWGKKGFALMQDIKKLFDPKSILNPGVIINDDPHAHVKHLKALTAAHPIVDKCIECGFCEPACPSKNLTLTPRQRISTFREINRLRAQVQSDVDIRRLRNLEAAFAYLGEKTCAATGLCAVECPVGIDTGKLVHHIRAVNAKNWHMRFAGILASQFGVVRATSGLALRATSIAQSIIGMGTITLISRGLGKITGGLIPTYGSFMPRGVWDGLPKANTATLTSRKIVYWPSCATQTMGASIQATDKRSVIAATVSVLSKAGYNVIYPKHAGSLCCGQPWTSMGFYANGDKKLSELNKALLEATENGKYPVLSDTSPCAFRACSDMKSGGGGGGVIDSRIKIYDQATFTNIFLLNKLNIKKTDSPLALHITCSTKKMGDEDAMKNVANSLSSKVVIPPEVTCCGFAGSKGFIMPELNNAALKTLNHAIQGCNAGMSNSRTCEIGLTRMSGITYDSIFHHLDRQSAAKT
eukprot:CFRG2711T1